MQENNPIYATAAELGIVLKGDDVAAAKRLLIKKINELIQTDFPKLISLLYRVDVSETRLKSLLKDNPESDAGLIITELLIERQAQKIRSRQQSDSGRIQNDDIDENEKW